MNLDARYDGLVLSVMDRVSSLIILDGVDERSAALGIVVGNVAGFYSQT